MAKRYASLRERRSNDQRTYLPHMPPILAFVVEAFVEHLHDFNEVLPERDILMIWPSNKRLIPLTG